MNAVDLTFIKEPMDVWCINPDAQMPAKANPSDVGYDIVITGRKDNRVEDRLNDLNPYHTGLAIVPPKGYHFEIIAHPSLGQQGYTLGNAITVVDPNARGELMINLFKFREGPDIEVPTRAAQLIVRETVYCRVNDCTQRSAMASTPDRAYGTSGAGVGKPFGFGGSTSLF